MGSSKDTKCCVVTSRVMSHVMCRMSCGHVAWSCVFVLRSFYLFSSPALSWQGKQNCFIMYLNISGPRGCTYFGGYQRLLLGMQVLRLTVTKSID